MVGALPYLDVYIFLYMQVLKIALGMVAPDVEIDDGQGTIMISSEEGETEGNFSDSSKT